MSNRVVPGIYRQVIDDVAEQVRVDFDEVGVEDAVLAELVRAWEYRVAASRVADFTTDPKMNPVAIQFPMLALQPVLPPPAIPTISTSQQFKSNVLASTSTSATSTTTTTATAKKETTANDQDEDAINSDLDDPDDDLDDDEDEQGQGRDGEDGQGDDIVIALYEKVQRVKNKWKVTLKDGLVSVNGREYLFNKCSGEFEW